MASAPVISAAERIAGNVQVALGCWSRPDTDALVSQSHMHGAGIDFGMDGHRVNAHLTACPVDAKRDFAAIGNQDLVEHPR